jgi:hypothetical protein
MAHMQILVIVKVFTIWTVKKMTMKGHLDELIGGIQVEAQAGLER